MSNDPHKMNVVAIRQRSTGYFWLCSNEHGAGWSERIRQSWTLRESTSEVCRIIENGWCDATDVEVVELAPRGDR